MSGHLEATWRPPGGPTWPTWRTAHLAHLATWRPRRTYFPQFAGSISLPTWRCVSLNSDLATWRPTFFLVEQQRPRYQTKLHPPGGEATWPTWRKAHLAPTWRTCHLAFGLHLATWPTWRSCDLALSRSTWRQPHLAGPPGGTPHLAHLATWRYNSLSLSPSLSPTPSLPWKGTLWCLALTCLELY